MRFAIFLTAMLFASAAHAQQQFDPDKAGYEISKNAVMLSEFLKGQVQEVAALRQQLKQRDAKIEDKDAKIKELEDKYEPKVKEPAPKP